MKPYIHERVIKHAEYIIETKSTIRGTAEYFKISKSTVHKDLSERLLDIDASLYNDIRDVLQYNKSVRHIRGGYSFKRNRERLNYISRGV